MNNYWPRLRSAANDNDAMPRWSPRAVLARHRGWLVPTLVLAAISFLLLTFR